MVRAMLLRRLLVLALVAFSPACGQEARWSAEWITAPGISGRDPVVLHFRKSLELAEVPRAFLVDVSADNQFVLYVNGREAGRGPSRGDLAHCRYERLDLGPLLHAGRNVL